MKAEGRRLKASGMSDASRPQAGIKRVDAKVRKGIQNISKIGLLFSFTLSSSFILHPSAFILAPSSFRLHPCSFILPPSSLLPYLAHHLAEILIRVSPIPAIVFN